VSKWYLAQGALEQGWWWLAILIVISSVIAVIYIGRIVEVAWFREPVKTVAKASDASVPLEMISVTVLLAAATIYFGIDTELTAGMASRAAEILLAGMK